MFVGYKWHGASHFPNGMVRKCVEMLKREANGPLRPKNPLIRKWDTPHPTYFQFTSHLLFKESASGVRGFTHFGIFHISQDVRI